MAPTEKSKRLLQQIAREGERGTAEDLSRAGFGERQEVQESLDELEETGRIAQRDEGDYEADNDKTDD